MAALEIIALDENTPQLRAPASGDDYIANRKLAIAPEANGNALAVTGFSLTGANAQSLASFSGTWNTTGTPTAIKLDLADTASNGSSLLLDMQVGGASKFKVDKNGDVVLGGNGVGRSITASSLRYTSGRLDLFCAGGGDGVGLRPGNGAAGLQFFTGSAEQTGLWADASGVLALRKGANPQAFQVYNTYLDASNYEHGFARWNANVFEIGTTAAGTGTMHDLALVPGGGGSIRMGAHTALGAETVTGYIIIKDAAGTLRKLAVVS